MQPIYTAALVLLALTLCLALLGMVLVRLNALHLRNLASYCQFSTVLVLAAAYALTHYKLLEIPLRRLDFWSLMVILGVSCYALVWGALAHQLNRVHHVGFQESFMLSMLYSDNQVQPPINPQDREAKSAPRK